MVDRLDVSREASCVILCNVMSISVAIFILLASLAWLTSLCPVHSTSVWGSEGCCKHGLLGDTLTWSVGVLGL